ncbi:MAG: DUF1573 domain-containing protein [Bacteroidota bacterium]
MKILSIVLIFLGYAFAYAQPQIVIQGNDVYDWGKINPKNKPLTAKVKIYNKGNKTLRIGEVKPDCGCTTAPLDKNVIEPNKYATLSISLKSEGKGQMKKSIKITSNDPNTPIKNLILKADVFHPISFSRKSIILDNLTLNKESAIKVVITNNTNKNIIIKNVITEPKGLITNINKNTVLAANKELTMEVKYTPKKSLKFTGKITLKTNDKNIGDAIITVIGVEKK